jgi:hypothetical protein
VLRDRAFRESPNIAGEVELREIVEEVGTDMAKERQSADVGDFVPGKVDVSRKSRACSRPAARTMDRPRHTF